ncbi:MAG: hypothetical protein AB1716_05725 [Planctomycetota bacterium]
MLHVPLPVVPALLAAFLTQPTLAQQERPPAAETHPAAAAQPAIEERVLPEIALQDVTLAQVLQKLREMDPDFQAVLAHNPMVDPNEPRLAELKLTRVTASQVLDAIEKAYPFVRVHPAASATGRPIWTVQVQGPQVVRAHAPEPVAKRTTTVYRLREALDQVEADSQPESRKAALDAVLELIEAALRADTPDKEQMPALRLHEPTETLVFRGTPEQAQLVYQTLTTLRPPSVRTSDLEYQLQQLAVRVAQLEARPAESGDQAGPSMGGRGMPPGPTGGREAPTPMGGRMPPTGGRMPPMTGGQTPSPSTQPQPTRK